jgi:1-acyl-sn-glycerol-3-phosphate acyltransferase
MLNFKILYKIAKVFSLTGKYLHLSYADDADSIILKRHWGRDIVNHFNLKILMKGKPFNSNGPSILIGNHISYLDIPILFYAYPDISFVSKKEVRSWPIIGLAATKAQTIFVERESSSSRISAKNQITTSLIQNNKKLVIFPSGTTSIESTSDWKKGVFEIAEKNNILVQPFRIRYEPMRPAAYIDQDNFLAHMYNLLTFKRVEVSLEFHEPVKINDCIADCNYWKKWCEEHC